MKWPINDLKWFKWWSSQAIFSKEVMMDETWHVLTKDCWLGCFVFWPPCSTPHTAGKDPSKKLGKVERCSVKKSWYAAYLCLVLIGYFLNNLLSEFLYAYQTSKKIFPLFKCSWYLIFCWGARRGCGGGGCNKILGIHNNTTKLPTKSQRKPKRWKINWSISASLQIFISKTPRRRAKWKSLNYQNVLNGYLPKDWFMFWLQICRILWWGMNGFGCDGLKKTIQGILAARCFCLQCPGINLCCDKGSEIVQGDTSLFLAVQPTAQ